MGRDYTLSFTAENKAKLIEILRSIDVMSPLRNGYRGKDATEPYAIAHLLSSLAEVPDALAFPLKLCHRKPPRDKPDFVLSMGGRNIGIEHVEARSENETRRDDLRREKGIGPEVYLQVPAEIGEPPRSRKELIQEIVKDDPPCGEGDQNNTDTKWATVMVRSIGDKEQKLKQYSRFDEDWLLIRDAWPFTSVDPKNAARQLRSILQERKTRLQFHRVFIISSEDRGPISEVTESSRPRLHRRNDLWSKEAQGMTGRKRLSKLYRFRALEPFEYIVDIMLNKRFYAAKPCDLNDPMEGLFHAVGGAEYFRDKITNALNQCRVCSFFQSYANPLYWAHYADGFRGICIEVIAKGVREYGRFWHPVDYDKTRRIVDGKTVHRQSLFPGDILEWKAEAWAYEHEVRAIITREFLPFDGWIKMSRVLLGIRTPPAMQELIRQITPHSVPVFTTKVTNKDKIEIDAEVPHVVK